MAFIEKEGMQCLLFLLQKLRIRNLLFFDIIAANYQNRCITKSSHNPFTNQKGDATMTKATYTPQVYDLKDIMSIMGLGRSSAYTWIKQVYTDQKPFRVIKVGAIYKIPKQSFDAWLNTI